MARKFSNLEQLLNLITRTESEEERVTLGMIVEAVGSRSFGSMLLLTGVILTSPLSGIPGMPTTMAVFLLMIAVQLLFGRKHFWLPGWILKRSIARSKLYKAIKWLQPTARFIDRLLKPRLTFLVTPASKYIIAAICVIIAFCLPVMELILFSASAAGAALTSFGLSLVSHDGFFALIAFFLTGITFGFIIYNLL